MILQIRTKVIALSTGASFSGAKWQTTQSAADLSANGLGSHRPHVHSLRRELSVSSKERPETTSDIIIVLLISKWMHKRAFGGAVGVMVSACSGFTDNWQELLEVFY